MNLSLGLCTLPKPADSMPAEDRLVQAKADGVVYTPAPIVDDMVATTLAPLTVGKTLADLDDLRVVDPACGVGAFVVGMYRYLARLHLDHCVRCNPEGIEFVDGAPTLSLTRRQRIATENVFGVDIDPVAVQATRERLREAVLEGLPGRSGEALIFNDNIRLGNALVDEGASVSARVAVSAESLVPFVWGEEFPSVFGRVNPGFDAVVGNPPYVDGQWMTNHRPAIRVYCRRHYAAAFGNWDLFCVFIEKALNLLRANGRHSFIVPNKLASADYAAVVRAQLAAHNRLVAIRDYSSATLFPAAVYPLVYLVAKERPPQTDGRVRVESAVYRNGAISVVRGQDVDYRSSLLTASGRWEIFDTSDIKQLAARIVAAHPRLDSVASVRGGATVGEAYLLAPLLRDESRPSRETFKVINSGTIDPWRSLWGRRSMRYLGRSYRNPVVDVEELDQQLVSRGRQARQAKLVIAGMTRRLEGFVDDEGAYLAAKSTTVVIPNDPQDLWCLAAIINSRLMTSIFAYMFGGLALRGGYFRVGPPQIRCLPLPCLTRRPELVGRLRALASTQAQGSLEPGQAAPDEDALERLVYELYGLSPEP